MPIKYESQLDDKNQHVVAVGGISAGDVYRVWAGLPEGIRKNRASNAKPGDKPVNAPAVTDITGKWKGAAEGKEETMEIKKSPSGYLAAITMASEGCMGEIEAPANLSGNVVELVKKEKENDKPCTITATFTGASVSIYENGCSYYHGVRCDFTGHWIESSKVAIVGSDCPTE